MREFELYNNIFDVFMVKEAFEVFSNKLFAFDAFKSTLD
jgi:hypothetical protein